MNKHLISSMASKESFTQYDLYEQCCKTAALESIVSSKILKDLYGYSKACSFVRSNASYYNSNHKFLNNFGADFFEFMVADLDKDPDLVEIGRFDPDSFHKGLDSMKIMFSELKSILAKVSESYDERLRFILYYSSGDRVVNNDFDFDKFDVNIGRIKRAQDQKDLYPALKDQFNQIFEGIYRPFSRQFVNLFSRYPGIKPDDAYADTERALSVSNCCRYGQEFKSDLRVMRNSLAHENYRIGETMDLIMDTGEIESYDDKRMMFYISMMQHKCMLMNAIVPFMNIEVLRTMEGQFRE